MKELKEHYKDYDMVRVMNVNNLILITLSVNLQIELVKIVTLMRLFKQISQLNAKCSREILNGLPINEIKRNVKHFFKYN